MRRPSVIFLTLLLLWAVVAQANHYLAPVHLNVFLGGLYVTYSALHLRLLPGYASVLAGGLLCDANSPAAVSLGTHTFFFAAAFAVIQVVRDRMGRDETLLRVATALVANLAIFLALSLVHVAHSPVPATLWPRLFLDLACSQVLLTLIAPWFFALQRRALELARCEPVPVN